VFSPLYPFASTSFERLIWLKRTLKLIKSRLFPLRFFIIFMVPLSNLPKERKWWWDYQIISLLGGFWKWQKFSGRFGQNDEPNIRDIVLEFFLPKLKVILLISMESIFLLSVTSNRHTEIPLNGLVVIRYPGFPWNRYY
jgi:hypothetical protein